MLLFVMLLSGFAELVSLGSVVPFLGVLNDPELIWDHPVVEPFAEVLGFSKPSQLLIPATLIFVLATLLASVVRLTNLWLNARLAASIGSDLSCESYKRTLYQPFSVHVKRNSSTVITATTAHISRTVSSITCLLQLCTSAIVASGLLIGLFLINWTVASFVVLFFGCSYGLLSSITRAQVILNSKLIATAAQQQIQALQEGLGAIREVLLSNNQQFYLDIYFKTDRPQRLFQAQNLFLRNFPRYVIEALALVTLALLGLVLTFQQQSNSSVVSLLGVLALGAQRLLPALQQIYGNWSNIKNFNSDIVAVLTMLQQPLPNQLICTHSFPAFSSICFNNVSFSYSKGTPNVLNKLSFEACRGERIGIIGSTGSGKSTFIDILMGLHPPSLGEVLVNGCDINNQAQFDYLLSWRSTISHVPQTIYLADCSIAENIAFGVNLKCINFERLRKVARIAQISEFIESCPSNYLSDVGEQGVRLSGGQRQRIGIARALYTAPQVLIFDEATSALDSITENNLMSAIYDLDQDLTILMIAHRTSTLQRCNRIIRLENGTITDVGPPSEIFPNS